MGSVPTGSFGAQLTLFIPKLWQMQLRVAEDNWRCRTALVRSIARLLTHAHPTQLARLRDVLVSLMALLGDSETKVRQGVVW